MTEQQLQDSLLQAAQPRLQYIAAMELKNEAVWEKLGIHTVGEALELWLGTLTALTAKNYRSGFNRLVEEGYVRPNSTLQEFALLNHDAVVDRIKVIDSGIGSECSRQARAACYISFTGFLCRRFQGVVRKAMPSKEGSSKTFFKVYDKVKTEAMSLIQWTAFLKELHTINPRDHLIAKITLQGGKRISEVLSLTVDRISWDKNEIKFIQAKTKGMYKETVITYLPSVMLELKEYIGDRNGLVFVTRTGKPIPNIQLNNTFAKAGLRAKIPFRVTPHVLRASAVTYYRQQGFSDSDISKITGHTSKIVGDYDKSSRADNASKKIALVH